MKIERWDSKANLWILDRIRENRKNELDHDGRGKEFIKQTTEEISSRIIRFLQRNGLECQDIQWLITGKNKKPHNQDDSHEQTVDNGNSIYEELETNLFPESVHLSFKNECGEYPTASSFALWKVAKTFEENLNPGRTVLIYNHYHSINHSLILIRKRQ